MSWSISELRVRLAPLNRFKPSSKIFYWPFQGGTSFVDLLCFCSVLCLLCFVRVCLYVLRGHLLGKGWPLGSRLWCLLWVCHFPIGILGQVWYLIVSIPDLCNLTYFPYLCFISFSYLDLYVLGDDALISKGFFMQTKHLYVLIHIWTKGEVGQRWNRFKSSSKIFLLTVLRRCFFVIHLCYFCLVFAMLSCASVYWCLVVNCWERVDLLTLVYDF